MLWPIPAMTAGMFFVSLMFILVGTLIVLPVIIGYWVFAYRVFRGKGVDLEYY